MRRESVNIYSLAVRLMGNAVDGEDLAQDTFLAAYRKFSQFRGEAAFGTWVYRICVNLWKNRVRYEKRRFFFFHRSLDAPEEDRPPLDLADPKDRAETAAEAGDRDRRIDQALQALDPAHRAVVVLRDVEDKSYEEIAELLDIPVGTVKSRLARARQELKARLSAFLEGLP
jgi:RNA polymerase sigma-70 factor (ECF subfamily)